VGEGMMIRKGKGMKVVGKKMRIGKLGRKRLVEKKEV
jgi:hypothetical protein